MNKRIELTPSCPECKSNAMRMVDHLPLSTDPESQHNGQWDAELYATFQCADCKTESTHELAVVSRTVIEMLEILCIQMDEHTSNYAFYDDTFDRSVPKADVAAVLMSLVDDPKRRAYYNKIYMAGRAQENTDGGREIPDDEYICTGCHDQLPVAEVGHIDEHGTHYCKPCCRFTVHSSHGDIELDWEGKIVSPTPASFDENYGDVVRFDLAEYKKYYAGLSSEKYMEFDILDLGFWLENGKYEPAEDDWRKHTWSNILANMMADTYGIGQTDYDEEWFDPKLPLAAQVAAYGEKYDMIDIRTVNEIKAAKRHLNG
jgi:hypothetical protein